MITLPLKKKKRPNNKKSEVLCIIVKKNPGLEGKALQLIAHQSIIILLALESIITISLEKI